MQYVFLFIEIHQCPDLYVGSTSTLTSHVQPAFLCSFVEFVVAPHMQQERTTNDREGLVVAVLLVSVPEVEITSNLVLLPITDTKPNFGF